MEKQGQCGVYKLYKLARKGENGFTKEFKKIEREAHVVTHDYADLINNHSEINGLQYEYDEVSDKLYWSKKNFKEVGELDELEKLREEYLSLTGKKAHHLMKEDKLIEEIEKLKN